MGALSQWLEFAGLNRQRTPEEIAKAKRSERLGLAAVFLTAAGVIGGIAGAGYYLGSHHAHTGQNNSAAANPPSQRL